VNQLISKTKFEFSSAISSFRFCIDLFKVILRNAQLVCAYIIDQVYLRFIRYIVESIIVMF